MSQSPPLISTWTDEAPALATYAFLPILRAFAGATGVPVETRDISLAGRILAVFPDALTPEQRESDGLAELVERGVRVSVERLRVITPHRERDIMTIPKNASRHGNRLAQQRLGFFEAL